MCIRCVKDRPEHRRVRAPDCLDRAASAGRFQWGEAPAADAILGLVLEKGVATRFGELA